MNAAQRIREEWRPAYLAAVAARDTNAIKSLCHHLSDYRAALMREELAVFTPQEQRRLCFYRWLRVTGKISG